MEGFNYPKKPESEYGFEEFKLTGKRIEALREALASISNPSDDTTSPEEIDIDSVGVPKERSRANIEVTRQELRSKIERYEELKARLAKEADRE